MYVSTPRYLLSNGSLKLTVPLLRKSNKAAKTYKFQFLEAIVDLFFASTCHKTPPEIQHGTWIHDGFPIGISFSKKGPFSGSMFVLGGCISWPRWPWRLIPLAGLHVRDVSWRDPIWVEKNVRKNQKHTKKPGLFGFLLDCFTSFSCRDVCSPLFGMTHQSISNFNRIGWIVF